MDSFLLPGEKILQREMCECRKSLPESQSSTSVIGSALGRGKQMRELVLTDRRLVHLEPYKNSDKVIVDWFIDDMSHVYVEKPLFGKERRLVVRFSDREHQDTVYTITRLSDIDEWKTRLEQVKEYNSKSKSIKWEIIKLLKSQERTTFDEILKICKDWLDLGFGSTIVNSTEQTDELVKTIISELIATNKVKGFIDKEKRQFMHIESYKQKSEVVQYSVLTSVEFGKNGAISLRCPHCGASQPVKEKSSQIVCQYCNGTYLVPKKILDLI